MFTREEIELKKQNFESSQYFFKIIDSLLNDDLMDFKDLDFQYFLITSIASKFISYKEDVWKKNKRTKTISTEFPRKILDDVVFKGELLEPKLSIHYKKKRIKYKFNKIEIEEILEDKKDDSVWIVDNIRDSIAHGHFYIDDENKQIVIKNLHDDRKLICKIDYKTFSLFEELISLERIGGYTNKTFKTIPIIGTYNKGHIEYQNFKNDFQLKSFLNNDIIPFYYEVKDIYEADTDKRYEDLTSFYNYFSDLSDKFLRKHQINTPYEQLANQSHKYAEENLKNYHVNFVCEPLSDSFINQIINYINEAKDFYSMPFNRQYEIVKNLITNLILNDTNPIERGIQNINDFFALLISVQNTNNNEAKNLYRGWLKTFSNSFVQDQKLANLFILGINNFVSNKESVYDKHFEDYTEFDVTKFKYKDYSGYDKLTKRLKELNVDLINLKKSLTKLNETKKQQSNNLAKAPEDRKEIICVNLENVNNLINETSDKINNVKKEITNIEAQINLAQTDSDGYYINSNNKSFFNHLRNAFAHNHIKYADDRLVYNRKIILEDIDDNGDLTFRCTCHYYDLVKLFNNDLFLEALNKGKTLKR